MATVFDLVRDVWKLSCTACESGLWCSYDSKTSLCKRSWQAIRCHQRLPTFYCRGIGAGERGWSWRYKLIFPLAFFIVDEKSSPWCERWCQCELAWIQPRISNIKALFLIYQLVANMNSLKHQYCLLWSTLNIPNRDTIGVFKRLR